MNYSRFITIESLLFANDPSQSLQLSTSPAGEIKCIASHTHTRTHLLKSPILCHLINLEFKARHKSLKHLSIFTSPSSISQQQTHSSSHPSPRHQCCLYHIHLFLFRIVTNIDLLLYLAAFCHSWPISCIPYYFANPLHLLAQVRVSCLSLVKISHSLLACLHPLLLQSCIASKSNLLRLLWRESEI
jgi:hypothetical protein